MNQSFVSIDLETTGLNAKRDRIIEIGAVKIIDGKEAGSFSELINPGRDLEERIVELTGIESRHLTQAPYIEEVLPRLSDFLEDLPLLGHNVIFDFSFLKKAYVDQKKDFKKYGIDTLRLARRFMPDLEHKTLGAMCEHFQIPLKAHRAMADAYGAWEVYKRLEEMFFAKEPETFEPKELIYQVKRDTPATGRQKERLKNLIEQKQIRFSLDIERLTRSEASRFIDKILAGDVQ